MRYLNRKDKGHKLQRDVEKKSHISDIVQRAEPNVEGRSLPTSGLVSNDSGDLLT